MGKLQTIGLEKYDQAQLNHNIAPLAKVGLHEIPENSQLIGSNGLRRLLTAKNNNCQKYSNSFFSSDYQRSKYLPNLLSLEIKQGAKFYDEKVNLSQVRDNDKPIIHQCEEMKEQVKRIVIPRLNSLITFVILHLNKGDFIGIWIAMLNSNQLSKSKSLS
ncbi:hypothetical protein FGO68_gene11377 [Halteria grandinella]|uniref:Uncharacterized protein n=1 Tax=Halteria grandinella TaxID=5974 RepID=A0A8J8T1P1_HALGN|nr:hypothetical protein FGO68_gene11377 [Halteria grandinella]